MYVFSGVLLCLVSRMVPTIFLVIYCWPTPNFTSFLSRAFFIVAKWHGAHEAQVWGLSVVTGRWTDGGIARAQRYLQECMAYKVDDERQLLMEGRPAYHEK